MTVAVQPRSPSSASSWSGAYATFTIENLAVGQLPRSPPAVGSSSPGHAQRFELLPLHRCVVVEAFSCGHGHDEGAR